MGEQLDLYSRSSARDAALGVWTVWAYRPQATLRDWCLLYEGDEAGARRSFDREQSNPLRSLVGRLELRDPSGAVVASDGEVSS